jgi:hypothetical protein
MATSGSPTVKRLAETVNGIDADDVTRIQRGLPKLFALLSASHATEALKRISCDPAMAVKSTFGAKLAAEAGRLSAPAAENPGATVLAFIQALGQAGGGSLTMGAQPDPPPADLPPPVVDADQPEADEPEAPAS